MSDSVLDEYSKEFVVTAEQAVNVVNLGKDGKLKILRAPPPGMPQRVLHATFLIDGRAVEEPKDCRRDNMGAWTSLRYRPVFG